jgi:hypothetical protein
MNLKSKIQLIMGYLFSRAPDMSDAYVTVLQILIRDLDNSSLHLRFFIRMPLPVPTLVIEWTYQLHVSSTKSSYE